MDYKSIILENAWGGLKMDYGLLHVQLATPVVVTCLILLLIFALNKLLFQPVLQTLDNREKIIKESQDQVQTTKSEIAKLSKDYEHRLNAARSQVANMLQMTRQEAQKQREALLEEAHKTADADLEKKREALAQEIKTAQAELQAMTRTLAQSTVSRLLS